MRKNVGFRQKPTAPCFSGGRAVFGALDRRRCWFVLRIVSWVEQNSQQGFSKALFLPENRLLPHSAIMWLHLEILPVFPLALYPSDLLYLPDIPLSHVTVLWKAFGNID